MPWFKGSRNKNQDQRLFTRPDTWHGGYYELALELGAHSDQRLCEALQSIWTYSSVEGCYLEGDREPSAQHRIEVDQTDLEQRLYGVAQLHPGVRVACGTFVVRETDGPDWVGFYIPMGAIEGLLETGGYPLNADQERNRLWQDKFDNWLIDLGKHVFDVVQYELGLIGHEVSGDFYAVDIEATGVPAARPIGFLWPSQDGVDFYPRNCDYGNAML